jgi:hypothetical protein
VTEGHLRAVPLALLVFGQQCTKSVKRQSPLASATGTVRGADKRLLEGHLGSLSSFSGRGGIRGDQGVQVGWLW